MVFFYGAEEKCAFADGGSKMDRLGDVGNRPLLPNKLGGFLSTQENKEGLELTVSELRRMWPTTPPFKY